MGVLHFLDVGNGDCSIIEHISGRNTVIDVCKARREPFNALAAAARPTETLLGSSFPYTQNALAIAAPRRPEFENWLGSLVPPPAPTTENALTGLGALARYGENPLAPSRQGTTKGSSLFSLLFPSDAQSPLEAVRKNSPTIENPIRYMRDRNINTVFRFILTHPDMDHMDGIKDFFEEFEPPNFWDSNNDREFDFTGNRFREEDWEFYKSLRDGKLGNRIRRLTLHAGARGAHYNAGAEDDSTHDGLYILAPTPALVSGANRSEDFNDASYVILYRSAAGRILFCGDSHDGTWEHILEHHLADVENVDLMIAPHHGRDSQRDRTFLTKVKPKMTLFGCAPSEHLAYDAWRNRGLAYIPGNQSGTVVVDTSGTSMAIYVANESFARNRFSRTSYSELYRAWYIGSI